MERAQGCERGQREGAVLLRRPEAGGQGDQHCRSLDGGLHVRSQKGLQIWRLQEEVGCGRPDSISAVQWRLILDDIIINHQVL